MSNNLKLYVYFRWLEKRRENQRKYLISLYFLPNVTLLLVNSYTCDHLPSDCRGNEYCFSWLQFDKVSLNQRYSNSPISWSLFLLYSSVAGKFFLITGKLDKIKFKDGRGNNPITPNASLKRLKQTVTADMIRWCIELRSIWKNGKNKMKTDTHRNENEFFKIKDRRKNWALQG